MTGTYTTRSKKLVSDINRELRDHSVSGKIAVRRSTIKANASSVGSTQATNDGLDVLGVFATADMDQDYPVLIDNTILVAQYPETPTNCHRCTKDIRHNGVTCDDCAVRFCSENCRRLAWSEFHSVLCGKDLSWLYDISRRSTSLKSLLTLRIVAMCIQSNTYPLKHPLIARLTANYDEGNGSLWSMANLKN